MEAIKNIHPTSTAWLRDSDLAPYVCAYVGHLVDRHYSANTVRAYLPCVAHFAHWMRRCGAASRFAGDGGDGVGAVDLSRAEQYRIAFLEAVEQCRP